MLTSIGHALARSRAAADVYRDMLSSRTARDTTLLVHLSSDFRTRLLEGKDGLLRGHEEKRLDECNAQLASATEEQSRVAAEIGRSITRPSEEAGAVVAGGTRETAVATERLSGLAARLDELACRFKRSLVRVTGSCDRTGDGGHAVAGHELRGS